MTEIYVDGKKVSRLDISTSGAAPKPKPKPKPKPDPEPEAPPGVVKFEDLNWASPGSQKRIPLGKEQIKYSKFTATSGTRYGGQISVSSTTGNSHVRRRVWISKTPGGKPFSKYGEDTGTTSTVIRWYQGPSRRGYCPLKPGQTYYINYQNLDCPSRCDVNRIIYNNGRPQ